MLLERVVDAVNRWPQYGGEAGVPAAQIKLVVGYHPEWVRSPRKLVAAAKHASPAKQKPERASRAKRATKG